MSVIQSPSKHPVLGKGVRLADILLTTTLLIPALPVMLLMGAKRKLSKGPVFERVHVLNAAGQDVSLTRFVGETRGWWLPQLFGVLSGKVCLLGTSCQFALGQVDNYQAVPGLLSVARLHQSMGLSFEDANAAAASVQRRADTYLLGLARALVCLLLKPRQSAHASERIQLLGVGIRNVKMDEMLDELCVQAADDKTSKRYAFVNADCLNRAYTHNGYRLALNSCDGVFADGIGIRIGASLNGQLVKDNVNGTDMFPRLCQRLADQGLGVYLLGGREGVAELAAQRMQQRIPELIVSGHQHGYFDPNNTQAVIDDINASGAAVLLVAMGAPAQELWIEQYSDQLIPSVSIGVGGLFDFYSGRISRAPLWLRQIGMEWIWRLSQEPTRMWRRYVVGNPVFLARVWKESRLSKSAPLVGTQESLNLWQQLPANAKTRCVRHHRRLKLINLTKRTLDIVVSALAMLALSPLLLITFTAIRLESPGPVFFTQQRAGMDNKPFTMWKLRSMYIDAEARLATLQESNEMAGGVLFKMKKDPRITRVGRIIRKASIDELPQLWNVFKGDMSLVGPRPALPREVAQYSNDERQRLGVRPGITCIWQVSGRSDIAFPEQVQLDLQYIHTQSVGADIGLMLKTIPAVLFARGAY